ncbi:cytochrome-c peroxidase [Segetibacter sp. 3557_3]|uniref:cytochrome-c peroxidase n=1 Tax=Segetibacter sp. 3557_3 TaxID=2547429 RepID=UPI0010585D5B|nr:cytochrome c peroxidase [Segetibacter sp. 3557_3]TDH21656.1 cytochrome-c peroxidase [Segetibacter sp. 3557_3]
MKVLQTSFYKSPVSRKGSVVVLLAVILFVFSYFTQSPAESRAVARVFDYYRQNLDSLNSSITRFEKEAPTANEARMRQLFLQVRLHYKKIEFLVEYHYPASAEQLNGPVIPESDPSEPNEPQHPSGFQVLEEHVYGDEADDKAKWVAFELSNISNRIKRLYTLLPELELSSANILHALRLNLYRLITKGITGFDSPIAQNSLPEAAATLESARIILGYFNSSTAVVNTVSRSQVFLKHGIARFDDFDRGTFIRDYLNKVCRELYAWQKVQQIPVVKQVSALRTSAETLFDEDGFDPLFYAPSGAIAASNEQVLLGKRLFADPALSVNGKRSCNSCHVPEKYFTDGLALNEALSGNRKLLRNTPSLINSALQPVQFYDSHIAFLEDQAHDVISNRQEMGGLFKHIVARLKEDTSYRAAFEKNYPDGGVAADNVKSALAAYVRSLIKMNSRFDQYIRGGKNEMSADELKGFNLFAGKAKCATCHFMPLFSGSVPPLFDKMESEVLGVPANSDTLHPIQDLDSGKYQLYHIPQHLFSFKTSTVRNAMFTAPYMHNGVFETLDQVMDFYDKGGGAGLGFELPNQTLPTTRLNLSATEKRQVIAFIKSLSNR